MAKKKVVRKTKSNDVAPMRLRGNMFLEYRAMLAELAEQRALLDLAQLKFNAERSKPEYAPLLKLQEEMQIALNDSSRVQGAFKAIQAKVAAKFGKSVDELNKHTINQHSGMIVFTPSQE